VFEKARAEFALPETEVAEQAYRFAGQIEPASCSLTACAATSTRASWLGRGLSRTTATSCCLLVHRICLSIQLI
jgi:hypothetical protein